MLYREQSLPNLPKTNVLGIDSRGSEHRALSVRKKSEKLDWFVINPSGRFAQWTDVFLHCTLIAVLVVTPYELAFVENTNKSPFSVFVTFVVLLRHYSEILCGV